MARTPTLVDRFGLVIGRGEFIPVNFCENTLAALIDGSLDQSDRVLTAVLENSLLARGSLGILDRPPSDGLYWLRRGFPVQVDLNGIGVAFVDEVAINESISKKGWRCGYGLVAIFDETEFLFAHKQPVLVLYTDDWVLQPKLDFAAAAQVHRRRLTPVGSA